MNGTKSLSNSFLAFIGGMVAWAFFGPKIKDKLSKSHALQQLKLEVETEAHKVKDLTQEAYYNIVDEVTDKYAKVQGISQNELKDLVRDLKVHWERIKSVWREESASAKATADKGGENK